MGGVRGEARLAPMHSPVNWALLGLVIERPSYAYELARRFERTYEGALSLSSVSHVYTALGTLRERGLIEEVAGTREGRQPKPRYRATAAGVEEYREWLLTQVGESGRRRRLFVLQLAALARDPSAAIEVLDHFERSCLQEAAASPIGIADSQEPDGEPSLLARLLCEERRLSVGSRLQWVAYARAQLRAPASAHSRSR